MGTDHVLDGPPRVPACFRETVRGTFALLLEAHDAAAEFGWDVPRSSVSVRELHLHGATVNHLRWLLDSGLLELVPGLTCGATAALTPVHPDDYLLGQWRVVLTANGVEVARCHLGGEGGRPRAELRPRWDAGRRTLWLGTSVVKQFRVPAVNQEIVLRVFEEEGWPHTIDDPIPTGPACEGRARLHNTIRRLNDRQQVRRLKFMGNGRGDGVSWGVIGDG